MFVSYGIEGFITIAVSLLICFLFFYFSRKFNHRKIKNDPDFAAKKYGIVWIIVGLIVSIIAFTFHLFFQIDLARYQGILRFLSEITAAPMLLISLLCLIIGLTVLFVGINSARFRRVLLDQSK